MNSLRELPRSLLGVGGEPNLEDWMDLSLGAVESLETMSLREESAREGDPNLPDSSDSYETSESTTEALD